MTPEKARELIQFRTSRIYQREQERKRRIQEMIERSWKYRIGRWVNKMAGLDCKKN